MPETICPNCGHSPIPLYAEHCPSCRDPFSFLQAFKRGQRVMSDRMMDHVDIEPTMTGRVLTGELSAHPAPAIALLLCGAVAWFLRATEALGPTPDPLWVMGLVGMNLVLVLVLLLNVGPIRELIKVGMGLQLCTALWLSGGALLQLVHLAYVVHAAGCFAIAVGEPSPRRRHVTLGVGLGAVLLGVLMRGLEGAGEQHGRPQELVLGEQSYHLQLPAGWAQLPSSKLTPHLWLPEAERPGEGVGFGHERLGRYGVLWVEPQASQKLAVGCKALLEALVPEATSALVTARRAPDSLGSQSERYEVRAPSGAMGSFACGHLEDGRRAGLVVVLARPDPVIAEQAFWLVGTGLERR